MAESINLYDSIYTLRDTRNRLKRALIRLGMLEGDWHEEEQLGDRTDGGFSLLDCRDAINNMGDDVTLTNRTRMNVATKKRVIAYDANLIASNIKKGVTILGVTGSYGGSGSTQTPRPYIWKYGTATALSTTPSGKYSKLTPKMADSSLTLCPENIRKDVDIMGVIGTYDYMHMSGLHGSTAATSATRYEVNLESLPYCPYNGYNTITEQNIQIGWITTNGRFDLNSDYFTNEVRYIVGVNFGKNLYKYNTMVLILDTLTYVTYIIPNQYTGWITRYERYYVNDPSSVLELRYNSATGFPTLTIDLSGATYKLFDSNEPSGSNVDIDIRFLTSADFEHMALDGGSPSGGTRQYHADIRW